MRMRTPVITAIITAVVALVLLPADAAAADADPFDPRAEGSYIEYTGTMTSATFDSDGVEHRDIPPSDITVSIECDDDRCLLIGLPFYREDLVLTDGSAVFEFGAEGNATCGTGETGNYRAVTITVEATASSFSAVLDEPSEGWITCPDGTDTFLWGQLTTIEAEYSSGDACVLDGSSCAVDGPVAGPEAEPGSGGAAGGAAIAPRDLDQPTALSTIPTVAESATVPNAIWAVIGTVVLVLLIALPTHFFNSAAERASELVSAWWRRVRPRASSAETPGDADSPRPGVKLSGWPLAAIGVLAASVIAAFADPAFAFDLAGLRAFLSILLSFGIEVVVGWFAVILLVRRTHPNAAASFRFSPFTLVIVLLAVLITRLTQFEPAIIFGLVAGVVFGGLLGTAERARVALIGLGWSFGIGVVAWIGYSVIAAGTGSRPGGALLFLSETLSAAAIAGISALPIALLPLRGLAGHTVWSWNRWIWGAAYAIGLAAFLFVLLPMPFSWAEVGLGIWTWIGLYLLYALVALGIWLLITRPWRTTPAAEPDAAPSPHPV